MRLRPCPFCSKPIPSKMVACPYCHRDEEGKSVVMDTAAAPPEDMTKEIEEQLKQLATEDPYRRDQAAFRLEKISMAATPRLTQVLEEHRMANLPAVAKVLGRIGDKRAIGALAQAMRSGEEELCIASVWALSQFRDPEAFAALLSEARRVHPVTQSYLASVLGGFQNVTAVPVLDQLARSANREVAFHAVLALGELRSEESVAVLQKAYRRRDPLIQSAATASLRRQGAAPRLASQWGWGGWLALGLFVAAAVVWFFL